MIIYPNAKINLGLNITQRRGDGYHNISTLFYPIDLCDVLEIVETPEADTTTLYTYGNPVECDPQSNLVMRAYNALKKHAELPAVAFHLYKHIPDGAGLGGGSADASFALMALRDMYAQHILDTQLSEIAASIGADCPFFIYNKPMYATGIGNVFSPAPEVLKEKYLILIKPDVYISTKEAYSHVVPKIPDIEISEIAARPIEQWKELLVNDFEAGAIDSHPLLGKIKATLYEHGAVYAAMSGSGSSMYGIFDSAKMAEDAFDNLSYDRKFLIEL